MEEKKKEQLLEETLEIMENGKKEELAEGELEDVAGGLVHIEHRFKCTGTGNA